MNSCCGFKKKLRKDKIMYANKNYNTDGKVYYMPNKMEIFLRIVEGLFYELVFVFKFTYAFFFLKKYLSNNTKGGSA